LHLGSIAYAVFTGGAQSGVVSVQIRDDRENFLSNRHPHVLTASSWRSPVQGTCHGSSDGHPASSTPTRHPPVLTASSWLSTASSWLSTASSWLSNGRLLRGTCRLSPAPRCAYGRDGLSFYSHRRLSAAPEMSPDTYRQASQGLLRRDLIAADGVRVQVLSLSPEPVRLQPRPMPRRDQVSACQAILAALTAHAAK